MTPEDVLDLIGIDISPARLKCALLSLDTLAHALVDDAAVGPVADGPRPAGDAAGAGRGHAAEA
jgi:hypothetical protein